MATPADDRTTRPLFYLDLDVNRPTIIHDADVANAGGNNFDLAAYSSDLVIFVTVQNGNFVNDDFPDGERTIGLHLNEERDDGVRYLSFPFTAEVVCNDPDRITTFFFHTVFFNGSNGVKRQLPGSVTIQESAFDPGATIRVEFFGTARDKIFSQIVQRDPDPSKPTHYSSAVPTDSVWASYCSIQ